MMKFPIRKGDKLENGGEVTEGSPWFEVMGRPLARKGDKAICEQHGPTTIAEGYGKFPTGTAGPSSFTTIAVHAAAGCFRH